jgi:hypothetical protein
MNIDDIYIQSSPLPSWHDRPNKFLDLAMLARRPFSILVTSVGAEYQFSSTGLTITERHSRLDADTVKDIFSVRSIQNVLNFKPDFFFKY